MQNKTIRANRVSIIIVRTQIVPLTDELWGVVLMLIRCTLLECRRCWKRWSHC